MVLSVISSLAIILLSKKEMVDLLYFNCVVTACALRLFLAMPLVGRERSCSVNGCLSRD